MFTDTSVFVTQIPYIDYEIYLGPIGLYDWQGASHFDVEFARSLPTLYDSGVKYHCQGQL